MDSFKNNPLAKKSMKAGMAMFSNIDGFPLRVKTYDQGVMVNDFEVLSLVTVKGRAADYMIPPGYRKQDIPALHGDGDGGLFPTRAP